MNRFYLFNTWIVIFFFVITGLFIVASCFYAIQLCLLNRKNKRFKKQNLQTPNERKRNYSQNIKLATKLEAKEVLASVNKKQDQPLKRVKKSKKSSNGTKKSSSFFQTLFSLKKKEPKQAENFTEEGYFSEFKNYYGDQLDGQAQSYESFETMTTDSECYRDWRHSIDFTNGILNLNNYNHHNNEIMQKAYEQLYAQQHQKKSTTSLNRTMKDEISIPVNDLYPVSVVPYDFEPQPLHLYEYQLHNSLNGEKLLNNQTERHLQKDQISQGYMSEEYDPVTQNSDTIEQEQLSSDISSKQSNGLRPDQVEKVNRPTVNEKINKLDTLVSLKNDGKIQQKLLTSSESRNALDRNMNLLSNQS